MKQSKSQHRGVENSHTTGAWWKEIIGKKKRVPKKEEMEHKNQKEKGDVSDEDYDKDDKIQNVIEQEI